MFAKSIGGLWYLMQLYYTIGFNICKGNFLIDYGGLPCKDGPQEV